MLYVPTSRRIAVLVDADNIQLSYLQDILEFSHRQGMLTFFYVYGDWKKPPLSNLKAKIGFDAVELRQVDRIGKDTTDKKLMIDGAMLLGADKVDTFIIVSGDGDFRQLVKSIRENSKEVIGIGCKKNTSRHLWKVCSKFLWIEDLAKSLDSSSSKNKT